MKTRFELELIANDSGQAAEDRIAAAADLAALDAPPAEDPPAEDPPAEDPPAEEVQP